MQSNHLTQSLFKILFERPRSERAMYLWVATVLQLLFLLGALSITYLSPFGYVSIGIFGAVLILTFFSLLYTAFAYIHYGACCMRTAVPGFRESAQRHMRLWEPAITVSYVLFAAPMLVLGTTRIFFLHLDWFPVDVLGYMEESFFVFVFFYITSATILLLSISLRKNRHIGVLVSMLLACMYIFSGIGTIYTLTMTMIEGPELYSDFTTFTDTHGKYIINYDGDYWLTYYTDKNTCYRSSIKCDPDWVKTGNASITFSPIPLEPFRDKEVVVHARQQRISSSLSNDHDTIRKYLCIGSYENCKPSTGPGNWYRSPLIIKSIQLK